jgi:hypothetical protein
MTIMLRTLLLATLGAALLAPSSALAAANWSSPVRVAGPAADPPGISSPRAFVTPDGRSLAVFGDGLRPALATGGVAGTFGAPLALARDEAGSAGVDAALGADGTLAVAWTAGGAAHVAVAPAGQRPAGQTDLPGAGVSDIAVAVAPDGAVTVAYRTKTGASSYALMAAHAAPGGAFGEPVTLHTSGQGIDGLDAAAGPGGAVAIAYRRLAPRYRAYAVVRPAGGAFGAPQALSPATQPDLQTRIAFQGDGTVVAAWTNTGGAAYALRAPGAPEFGAPAPLGAAEATYQLDLAPTPQGGIAAAWSTGSQVRAAVKAPGAGFGDAQTVVAVESPIAANPSVAVAPGGQISVAVTKPGSGAVTVTDLGGTTQTVGYGPVEIATPIALAAGADRTVAVWRDAGGALAAATRSEQAPAGGPGAAPAAPDRTRPKVTSHAPRRLTVTRRTSAISFKVSCNEACSLLSTGNMRTTRGGKRVVSPLRAFTSKKLRTGRQTVKLTLGPGAQKDLRRALDSGRGARVFFDVTAVDAAGNSTRIRGEIALRARSGRR